MNHFHLGRYSVDSLGVSLEGSGPTSKMVASHHALHVETTLADTAFFLAGYTKREDFEQGKELPDMLAAFSEFPQVPWNFCLTNKSVFFFTSVECG